VTATAGQREGRGGVRLRAFIRGLSSLLFALVLTFFGLTVVTFVIGRVIPIDPVLAIVGDHAAEDVYARVRAELGLDLPVWVQYGNYLRHLMKGDFGNSVITTRPVLHDLIEVFPATVELATFSLLIGVGLGVPMGVAAAMYQGRWPDKVFRFVALIGYSVPVFWLGLVGLLVLYARLGWVAGPGRLDIGFEDLVPSVTGIITIDSLLAHNFEVFGNALQHLVLPASILGYQALAQIARMTRSLMIGQLHQDYVIAARAKGLPRWRIVWVHAFGNIWVPFITVVALTYGILLEGAVLTETVFAWPGLGLYMKNSLFNADLNAVLGGTILIGIVFIALNLLSDLVYPLVDPRAR
jgi:peptide/nickel transport system permease protein